MDWVDGLTLVWFALWAPAIVAINWSVGRDYKTLERRLYSGEDVPRDELVDLRRRLRDRLQLSTGAGAVVGAVIYAIGLGWTRFWPEAALIFAAIAAVSIVVLSPLYAALQLWRLGGVGRGH